MIAEIRLTNFYSIKNEVVFHLGAGQINTQKAKLLQGNVAAVSGNELLKSVALYGANASGKSNIIKAIQFCCRMIFNSHLHNEGSIFNFSPFKFEDGDQKPSRFLIRFFLQGIEYEYSFSLTTTEIVEEALYYYPKGRRKMVFNRNEGRGKEKSDIYQFTEVIPRPMDVAFNTSKKTLYISRASQMDREIAKEIFNFFHNHFILGYLGYNAQALPILFKEYKSALLTALRMADSDIVNVELQTERVKVKNYLADLNSHELSVHDEESDRLRIVTFHRADPSKAFDFFTEESEGTKALFYMMLTIIDVVAHDKILLIDEIERSLHPEIVEYIVRLFHASKGAQLIYSTHNTNLLNLDLLRKDQIWFVNKKEGGVTELYSLFDFKDFRDTMDVEKAYLQGRFDAIPYINETLDNLNAILHGQEG